MSFKKIKGFFSAPFKIWFYLNHTPKGQRKLILGGHWSNHKGWLVLDENDQDITKKLKISNKEFYEKAESSELFLLF